MAVGDKNTKKKETGSTKKKKKAKSSVGLYVILALVLGVPMIGLLGWYMMTAVLNVSGSKLSAGEMLSRNLAKVQVAMRDDAAFRATKEGFSMEKVDDCQGIVGQYEIFQDTMPKKDVLRNLIGLPSSADKDEVFERCVVFAKIVKRMEKLAHHTRHVFMCGRAEFTMEESARFRIMPDPDGRGLIESLSGRRKLVPISRGTHKLVRQWQVFNMGDGCIVIGMSNAGRFSLP